MPDFPISPNLMNAISIGSWSLESLGIDLRSHSGTWATSNAWGTNNLALYIPVEIYYPVTIVKMSINNGSTVNGNIDLGIYDVGGAKLVSKGSTAQSGTSAIQTLDITDTLLLPGLYYMGVAFSSTTGTCAGWNGLNTQIMQQAGIYQQASGFALPATATFATFTGTIVPLVTMTPKVTI